MSIKFKIMFLLSLVTTKFTMKIAWFKNGFWGDFPGGAVVKNPPANAGNMSLIPGLGRSHMPRSNKTCEPQLLSPCTLEPVLLNY